MQPVVITDRDRENAQQRAQYTSKSFREILRNDLHDCLDGRDSVSIDEFVSYFNGANVARRHKQLDTRNAKYPAYFEALDDVCRVSSDYTRLYPLVPGHRRQGSRRAPDARFRVAFSSQSRQASGDSQLPRNPSRSKSQSPPSTTSQQGRSLSLERGALMGKGNLTINQLQRVLIDFTHTLTEKTIHWEEYLRLLKEHNAEAYERLHVLKATESERMEFIRCEVSGDKNRIDVKGPGPSIMVEISRCLCCQEPKFPYRIEPLDPPSHGKFAYGLSRFRKIELPLNKWLEVQVADVDPLPPKLIVKFIWKNSDFEVFHDELRAANVNNTLNIDIEVGMQYAVPYEGTKDYHRGVVKDISDPSLPPVYYVDLGVEQKVARGCIRFLQERFMYERVFCLDGEVRSLESGSSRYDERVRMGHKLMKKGTVSLKAEKYDTKEDRYRVILDTDSGIASDASRD